MTRKELAKGMALLAVAYFREMTEPVVDVYWGVLKDIPAPDWERAVQTALRAETYFPPPAVLRRYATRPASSRAAELYEQILAEYERGNQMGPREVQERFGTAAMEAFVCAGGTRAFSWCEPASQPFRLKAFLEAWAEVADLERPALPAGEQKRLKG